jgi:hemerythrin-like domain-containing protein
MELVKVRLMQVNSRLVASAYCSNIISTKKKGAPVPEVLDRLHSEHADLSRLLDALELQLQLFSSGERVDYDMIGAMLRYCQEYPDAVHHPTEDLIYRAMKKRDPALARDVADLEDEHRVLAEKTRELADKIARAVAEQPVERSKVHELTNDFLARYRRHISREEAHMFPAAWRVLTEDDWAEIDRGLKDIVDPLFGEVVSDRFQNLREDIDRLVAAEGA